MDKGYEFRQTSKMDQYRTDLKAKESQTNDVNLLHMLESRITEIVRIEREAMKKFPKLFHQRLPRFMRRRAASHNLKRIPKFRRPNKINTKDRRKLLVHRRKVRYLKHKRVIFKSRRHVYKHKNKCLLHKWFAKRFRIERTATGLEQVPLHNNTKNQRNLYRQTRYGCAYLSMAHLVAIQVENENNLTTREELNKLTKSISGFTFSAKALESGRYEIVVHLFRPKALATSEPASLEHVEKKFKTPNREYICPAYVINNNNNKHLILWLPRSNADEVIELYRDLTPLSFKKIQPCEWVRVRLIGPKAREEALKIVEEKEGQQKVMEDVDRRLLLSHGFGVTLGRFEDPNSAASFTYYQTEPPTVDVVFRHKAGRTLWHKLIKNKAHLVGGKRDVDNLFSGKLQFCPVPDNLVPDEEAPKRSPRRRGRTRRRSQRAALASSNSC